MDMSNMLKPKLARGELQLVGATTLDEYRLIEKEFCACKEVSERICWGAECARHNLNSMRIKELIRITPWYQSKR